MTPFLLVLSSPSGGGKTTIARRLLERRTDVGYSVSATTRAARAGRTPEALAKEFEPSAQTIRNWVVQADRDGGTRADGLTTTEREEMTRLRRENRPLKVERDILANAAAWFARETDTIPSGSTGS